MPTDTEEQELGITAHGYLASPISDNIREMEDGTLVVESCPIARTGWMTYAVRDLPQEAARRLGVDVSNPSANIDLYRAPQDVFAPEFLASLNGRPVTENHPPDFVTPDTFSKYALGHIQNVRKGDEPLDNGDWPIVADLIISGEPLVSKVLSKQLRELSLGYDYAVKRVGEQIRQVGMMGNHLAVVPQGRAGDEVRINDAAPTQVLTVSPRAAPSEPEATKPPGPGARLAAQTVNATPTKKEKPKVKNNLLHILGLGLRAKAADADTDPEELAKLAVDIGKHGGKDSEEEEEELSAEDRCARDRKARDRKKARDLEEDSTDYDHEPVFDRKKRAMHDALDKLIDGGYDKHADDEDLNELGDMLKEFFGQEAKEPEHQVADVEEEPEAVDADPAELEELLGKGEEPDAEDGIEPDPGEEVLESGEEALVEDGVEEGECAHCGEVTDAVNCPSCGCKDRKPVKDKARAADAAVGVKATLKYLRPFIARSNDAALKVAFNTTLGMTTRTSRAGSGGYGAFANSARARDSKRIGSSSPIAAAEAANTKLQSVYDQLHEKGGK